MSEQLSVVDDNFSPANSFSFEAGKINENHRQVEYHIDQAKRHVSSALEYAVTCGKELAVVKNKLNHGEYLPWLKANVTFSHTTASQYIKIAETMPTLDANLKSTLNLLPNITSAIQFLTAPDTVKKEVFTALNNGETLTAKEIENIKKNAAKAEREKLAANNKAAQLELALKAQEQKNDELKVSLTAERQGVLKVVDEKLAEQKEEIRQQAQAEMVEASQEIFAELESDYVKRIESLQEKVSEKEQVIQRLQAASEPVINTAAPVITLKDNTVYERSAQSINIALNTASNTIVNSTLLRTLKEGQHLLSDKSKKQLLAAIAEHKSLISDIETILN